MTDATGDEGNLPDSAEPGGHYWDDPVYRYLSGGHRAASDAAAMDGDDAEATRLDALMQDLVNGTITPEQYWALDAEARAERKKRHQERKQQGRARKPRAVIDPDEPSVNVADLKKRIFNPHVSRENVIKALEALPPSERKATIAGLPPGLRRRLGEYLKNERR